MKIQFTQKETAALKALKEQLYTLTNTVSAFCLNPRFDGAFLNSTNQRNKHGSNCLNPRFDGAFLNC